MPANLESGMFVRQPAWHGEGFVADRYPADWDEAREWAGLTWEPIEVPSFGFNGVTPEGQSTHIPDQAASGDYFADANHKRIVRSDTGDLLAVRHDQYTPITHAEMGSVVQAILQQDNVKYDTAGSLQGGRAVWALAYLDEPIVIAGDNTETFPYLALLNRHDGEGAFRALSTTVRIVCSNTMSSAEAQSERNNVVFTFRHSANWKDHIEEARQTIRGVRETFSQYVEFAEELTKMPVNDEQRERFVVEFIPVPPSTLVSDRVMKNVEQARSQIREILASPTTETIRGNAFGLVQAAGEYLDHYRATRTVDSHYKRQLLAPEALKSRAVTLAREVVKV